MAVACGGLFLPARRLVHNTAMRRLSDFLDNKPAGALFVGAVSAGTLEVGDVQTWLLLVGPIVVTVGYLLIFKWDK